MCQTGQHACALQIQRISLRTSRGASACWRRARAGDDVEVAAFDAGMYGRRGPGWRKRTYRAARGREVAGDFSAESAAKCTNVDSTKVSARRREGRMRPTPVTTACVWPKVFQAYWRASSEERGLPKMCLPG